ncbi:MAG: hypothetical protein MUF04_07415, partial [Akkermansiaceae bacterium]|nr:hypothetical protein [Akkermansiaceae bacterium]
PDPIYSAQSAGFADADGDEGLLRPETVGAVRDDDAGPFGAAVPATPATPDPFDQNAAGGPALRLRALPPANSTHLWLEANYYAYSGPTGEDFIPLNRFWLDLAAWDGEGPFLSPHFNACTHNANDALLCLALLDLPFKAERPEAAIEDGSLRVKARDPLLLYFRDIRRAGEVEADAPVLVRQVFWPIDEPLRHEGAETVENAITGGFRTGVPYSLALTVTNPGGAGLRIEVLAQIPAGAIPLAGRPATLAETHRLKPDGVLSLELAFYFPEPGEFTAYPLHVSANGVVLAHTEARTLRVATRADADDPASWSALAADGTTAAVLARLRTANLDRTDLSLICWRLTDREVFGEVTAILRERLHHSPAVAAYGFHHNDPDVIREYLENSAAIRQLGAWLDSPLLAVRPRQHLDWELAEFDPLVNARAHRFVGASRLTHEAAREHYHDFLDQLAWKPTLEADDHLTLAAFLFLQDRVEEALARFDRVDPARLPGRLQYDYFRAVALWYREQPDEARAVAAANLPGLPPGLWRDRFQAVIDQADELAALTKHAAAGGPPPVAAAPGVELAMAGPNRLLVKHRGLESLQLHLFSVDLETLFSKDPFFTDGAGAAPSIRPNETLAVPLAADRGETLVDLPPELGRGNLLVSATGGPVKLLKVMDSAAIDLRRLPATSILQTLDAASGLPLAKTYVKVYAQTTGGAVLFHKDGYTDPRGMFDFLAHTGVDPASVKRLAILVSHPANGARTVVWSP